MQPQLWSISPNYQGKDKKPSTQGSLFCFASAIHLAPELFHRGGEDVRLWLLDFFDCVLALYY